MYNIENLNIGNILKENRLKSKLSLEEVGNLICKSKATVSKYERNEILPDIYVLVELCNILNINISEFFQSSSKFYTKSSKKIFSHNKLYLYYYTGKKLIISIIDILYENNNYIVKMYNDISSYSNYKRNFKYYYEGTLDFNKDVGYIHLKSINSCEMLEYVDITFRIPWTSNYIIFEGIINAMTPDFLPIVKKIILSPYILKKFEDYKEAMSFTNSDCKEIYKNNAFIFKKLNL